MTAPLIATASSVSPTIASLVRPDHDPLLVLLAELDAVMDGRRDQAHARRGGQQQRDEEDRPLESA